MSKAFLLVVALALTVACASAAQAYIKKDLTANAGVCPGYLADGKWFLTDNTYSTFDTWKAQDPGKACLAAATTVVAADFVVDPEEANAACYAKGAVKGAAPFCGVQAGGECTATNKCVVDYACTGAAAPLTCTLSKRFVVKISNETKADGVQAAVDALLDALMDEAQTPAKACPAADSTLTIEKDNLLIAKGWTVATLTKGDADCLKAIAKASTTFVPIAADECAACTPYPFLPDWGNAACPCADPAQILGQAKYTLVSGKKMGDLEKLFKDAVGDCLVAYKVFSSANSTVIVQTVQGYSAACQKENGDRKSELDKIATPVSGWAHPAYAEVAECYKDNKFQCVADNAKCDFVCPKGTACTTANQEDVCGTGQCVDSKCNSASVVGYVVAVVAVIAAFVF